MKILYLGLDPTNYLDKGDITHYPIIKIIPRHDFHKAFEDLHKYTHLILTSQSTIAPLLSACSAKKCLFNLQVLSVGKKTTEKAMLHGFTKIKTAKKEYAEGIVEIIDSNNLSNYYFWPHSSLSRPVITEYLKKHALPFKECIAYDTITNIPEGKMPDCSSFDEIVFTSPSTVRSFLDVFGRFPSKAKLSAIGPITRHLLHNFHLHMT